jgi:hypothetical protein
MGLDEELDELTEKHLIKYVFNSGRPSGECCQRRKINKKLHLKNNQPFSRSHGYITHIEHKLIRRYKKHFVLECRAD